MDIVERELSAAERLQNDILRLIGTLEDVQDRCRKAAAEFEADQSVPTVKQMIALGNIRSCLAHNMAGIDLVRQNASKVLATYPTVDTDELLTGEQAWDILVEADDRNSPEEYPDMCLITRDELIEFMASAHPHASEVERLKWDQRYRRLDGDETIALTDEVQRDDGSWMPAVCVGEPAPDPNYSSHRVYRRLAALTPPLPLVGE